MKKEDEIMQFRNRRALWLLLLGAFLSTGFFYEISSGTFDDLKTISDCDCEEEEEAGIITESKSRNENSEGALLFKTHCSSCHLPDSDATGPALSGAKERWAKNASEDDFYSWIENSEKLARDGNLYAIELKKEYPNGEMPAFNLSRDEIDLIFDYID